LQKISQPQPFLEKFREEGSPGLKALLQDADVLINTTTLGMHPNTDTAIATAEELYSGLTVFDIVYNPLETRLLKEAKASGAKTVEWGFNACLPGS